MICCPHCGEALDEGRVSFDGKVIELTAREADIFSCLILRFGRLVSRQHIYGSLYSLLASGDQPDFKIIDVLICRMRAKLRQLPVGIRTVWGRGLVLEYRPVEEDVSEAA